MTNGPRKWGLTARYEAFACACDVGEIATFVVRNARSAQLWGICLSLVRWAVARKNLPAVGCGLDSFLEDALALRAASSTSAAFFGVRRASEVAALNASEVRVDLATGIVDIKFRRQKDDQFGVGQLAHLVSLPLWGGACPVHLLSGWPWLGRWLAAYLDHAQRLSGAG